jgi:hypothetical protein
MKHLTKPAFSILFSVILLSTLFSAGCALKKTTPTTPVTSTFTNSPLTITTAATTTISTTTTAAVPVPSAYQALYSELSSEMGDFEGTLSQKSAGATQPVFATDLLLANGNVGPGLLTQANMNNNITLLNRLQAMGFKGVVIAIKFPLLKPDFPNSAGYLSFYQQIINECHKRGMKVLVECGAIFSGTAYSSVTVDWTQYTTQSFLQGLENQLLLVAAQVRPDYLTLANEPETDELLTGLSMSPSVWANFIADTVSKVDRSHGILVGAGTGTWENPAYINGLFNMPGLDYIDLHIYAMNTDGEWLQRALDWATQARTAGKRVTISECWLWKASPAELGSSGIAVNDEIMDRDAYSFWEPLDARYLQDMMKLARVTGMDFASFFWMRNFFAYLDYGPATQNLTTQALNTLLNQTYVADILTGNTSMLGLAIQQQLK